MIIKITSIFKNIVLRTNQYIYILYSMLVLKTFRNQKCFSSHINYNGSD